MESIFPMGSKRGGNTCGHNCIVAHSHVQKTVKGEIMSSATFWLLVTIAIFMAGVIALFLLTMGLIIADSIKKGRR